MNVHRIRTVVAVGGMASLALGVALAGATPAAGGGHHHPRPDRDVRFATFNASLNRAADGELVQDLATPDDEQARTVAEIIQRADPDTETPADWYSEDELADLRLSSKSHWDVPIRVGDRGRPGHQGSGRDVGGRDSGGYGKHRSTVHFLVSHPTPPVFDGAEDRNGRRNSDEIRFWADYVGKKRDSRYIYDDEGRRGGLDRRDSFVVAGDLNSDPLDGDSLPGSADQLLDLRRVNTSVVPTSEGAVEASELQGGPNLTHRNDPRFDTADFAEPPGNIRADYVLPSRDLRITGAEVFWPESTDPLAELTGSYPFSSSDHRLVFVDVRD